MFSKEINERTSFRYTGTLHDRDGSLVVGSQLTTLEFWLFDVKTNQAINDRGTVGGAGQNAKNVNGWTIYDTLQDGTDEDGNAFKYNVLWDADAADSKVVGTAVRERHRGVLKGTWGTNAAKGFTHEFEIMVVNVSQVSG